MKLASASVLPRTSTCSNSHLPQFSHSSPHKYFSFLKTPPPLHRFSSFSKVPTNPPSPATRHSHGTLNRERPIPFPHHTHTKSPPHNHRPAHPHTSGRRHPATAAAHNPSRTTHSSTPPVPTYRSTNPFPQTNHFQPHCSNPKTPVYEKP